jgi:Zn-dependent oligopeptidase
MSEIRDSVSALRSTLQEIKQNTEASRSSILTLNLREARDRLSRRIQEVSPATAAAQDPSLAAATREARVLLSEVDAEFF